MHLHQEKYQYLACIIASIFLSACQSAKVNTVTYDLPSPQGNYHVVVKQCRANDAMFGPPTQLQVAVLKSGQTENCRAVINSIRQFTVYGRDHPLQLKWLSETELLAVHPQFKTRGADVQRTSNIQINIRFAAT